MKKSLRKLGYKIVLIIRKFNILFKIDLKKGIPRLHIHEELKNHVKWTLRILTFIGIISSVFSFQLWYWNLSLAILILAFGQFLERVIFIFTTIYITPIPESYTEGDWMGMVWGIPREGEISIPFIASPFFKDKETAIKIFKCLKSWNYDQKYDFENNIQLSAIVENEEEYSMYMYPSMERKTFNEWIKQVRKERPDQDHQSLVMQIVFCRRFRLNRSNFLLFQKNYVKGRKFIFAPYYVENNQVIRVDELGFIVKDRLKIKKRNELTRQDLEFDYGKFVMNK